MEMIEMEDLGAGADVIKEAMHKFKENLLSSVITRFTTPPPPSGKRTAVRSLWEENKIRHIVTVDIFHSEEYILAAVLDPRWKLIPFQGETQYLVN